MKRLTKLKEKLKGTTGEIIREMIILTIAFAVGYIIGLVLFG